MNLVSLHIRNSATIVGILLSFFCAACSAPTSRSPIDEGPLQADLSVCRNPEAHVQGNTAAALPQFARKLHGTWKLSTRSIQGVAIDAKAQFYFDLSEISDSVASGSALCLDRGNLRALDPLELCPECIANAAVGAHWKVNVERKDDRSLLLSMAGEYLGSYGDFRKGITGTEQAEFFNRGGVYVAGKLTSPAGGHGFADDTWDLISLTDDTLTYISCGNLYLDQYTKISSGDPAVDGMSLEQTWEKRKQDGSLLNPLPVWEESQ